MIPAFKEVFSSFGADLPAPTLIVMGISDYFVQYWWLIFGILGGGIYFFMQAWKRNERVQQFMDRTMLKVPIFGVLIEKSCVARWTRTLSTMFAAGVPLVEALTPSEVLRAITSTGTPRRRFNRKSPQAPA